MDVCCCRGRLLPGWLLTLISGHLTRSLVHAGARRGTAASSEALSARRARTGNSDVSASRQLCTAAALCASPDGRRGTVAARGEEAVSYQQPPDHEPGTAAGPSPGGYQDQDERAPRRYSSQWDQQAQPVPGWQESRLPYPPQSYGQPRQPSSAPDPHYGPPPGQPPYQGQPQYPPRPYGRDVYQQAQPYGQRPWPPPEPHRRPRGRRGCDATRS